jgi:MtfA peptidase
MSSLVSRVLVPLASGLVILIAFLVLRPLLLRLSRREELRQESQPIPERWFTVLDSAVPAAQHLDAAQRQRLLRASRGLMRTRHWEGCRGLALTEAMQLTIAAQACLLTLKLPGEPFPGVREILVYPETFVARRVCDPRKWLEASDPQRPLPLLGESWGNGVMVLSWDAVEAGSRNPGDGSNVVLHEFAHELDFERHLTPRSLGASVMIPTVAEPEKWQRVLVESFERLCFKIESHAPSALNAYGATNIQEFFAVATETFFEKPVDLAHEEPELYAQLRDLYQQDPAPVA